MRAASARKVFIANVKAEGSVSSCLRGRKYNVFAMLSDLHTRRCRFPKTHRRVGRRCKSRNPAVYARLSVAAGLFEARCERPGNDIFLIVNFPSCLACLARAGALRQRDRAFAASRDRESTDTWAVTHVPSCRVALASFAPIRKFFAEIVNARTANH